MDANRPVLFVIFGVSGDLSRRKLLPALYRLVAGGKMPSNYQIIGVSRQNDYTVDQLFPTFHHTFLLPTLVCSLPCINTHVLCITTFQPLKILPRYAVACNKTPPHWATTPCACITYLFPCRV